MSVSRFRSSLRLESLDGRVLPDATPLAPPASQPQAVASDAALASTTLQFDPVASTTSYTVTITIKDYQGNVIATVGPVTTAANATPSSVATTIASAINDNPTCKANGVTAAANGKNMSITGPTSGGSANFQTNGGDPNMHPPTLGRYYVSGQSVTWNGQKPQPATAVNE
jgi:hypothetical protein